ncbi:Hypothetical predicted protein [Podarcis lilfordi]|uniref:Uncharacterized protein n=1 Tax=Podarcis lilfordi TaxID=74358 RepID=A0AA35L6X1_9SAUR|nr:Hypothetical predicted protein [Podarcis lilfordi]
MASVQVHICCAPSGSAPEETKGCLPCCHQHFTRQGSRMGIQLPWGSAEIALSLEQALNAIRGPSIGTNPSCLFMWEHYYPNSVWHACVYVCPKYMRAGYGCVCCVSPDVSVCMHWARYLNMYLRGVCM